MFTIVQGVGNSLPKITKFNEVLGKQVPLGVGPNKFVRKTDAELVVDKLRKLFPKENYGLARVVGVEAIREYIDCKVVISPEKHSDVFLSPGEHNLHLIVGINQLTLDSLGISPFHRVSVLQYLVETYGQEWNSADLNDLALAKLRINLKIQRQIMAEAEEKAEEIYTDICLLKRKMYKG